MGIKLEDLIVDKSSTLVEDKSKKAMNVMLIALIIVVILIIALAIMIIGEEERKRKLETVMNLISDTEAMSDVVKNYYSDVYKLNPTKTELIGKSQEKGGQPISVKVCGQEIEYKYGYYLLEKDDTAKLIASSPKYNYKRLNYPDVRYVVNYVTGEVINLYGIQDGSDTFYEYEDLVAIRDNLDAKRTVKVIPSRETIYIGSANDFNTKVRQNPGKRYKLTKDIDMSVFNTGEGWEPIKDFTGEFNGRGYKISGLYISRSNEENVGLFANVTAGGKISNLVLENVEVGGGRYTGAIAGSFEGTIKDSSVSGKVTSTSMNVGGAFGGFGGNAEKVILNDMRVTGTKTVGGFVGLLAGGNISKCAVKSSKAGSTIISSTSQGDGITGGDVGGFVGTAIPTKAIVIEECMSNAVVDGVDSIGGFVGSVTDKSASPITIKNAYAHGSISNNDKSTNAGGFIGSWLSAIGTTINFENLYTIVKTPKNCISGRGGFMGKLQDGTKDTVSNNGGSSGINTSYCYFELNRLTDADENNIVISEIGINESTDNSIRFEAHTKEEMQAGGAGGIYSSNSWTNGVWLFESGKYPVLKWED